MRNEATAVSRRTERPDRLQPFIDDDVLRRVIAIIGGRIPGLAFPVRDRARLSSDLHLSADDLREVEREVEREFGIAAVGRGRSWVLVADVARFVSLRLLRGAGR